MKLKDRLNLECPTDFYTDKDPDYLPVDNRPLYDLFRRDEIIATSFEYYSVIVDADGVTGNINEIPKGWSVSKEGAGIYRVIHNLNLEPSKLNPLVSVITDDSPILAYVSDQDFISFTVSLISVSTGNPIDSRIVVSVSTLPGELFIPIPANTVNFGINVATQVGNWTTSSGAVLVAGTLGKNQNKFTTSSSGGVLIGASPVSLTQVYEVVSSTGLVTTPSSGSAALTQNSIGLNPDPNWSVVQVSLPLNAEPFIENKNNLTVVNAAASAGDYFVANTTYPLFSDKTAYTNTISGWAYAPEIIVSIFKTQYTFDGTETYRFWVYPMNTGTTQYIASGIEHLGNSLSHYFAVDSAGALSFYRNGATFLATQHITFNSWNFITASVHIVTGVQTVNIGVNGVVNSSTSGPQPLPTGDYYTFILGNSHGTPTNYALHGAISNFQFLSGYLYTSNFTPPTAPFPIVSGGSNAIGQVYVSGTSSVSQSIEISADPYDPYFSNIIFLAPLNSGPTFTEMTGQTITQVGTAGTDITASSTNQLFGSNSARFDPSSGTMFDKGLRCHLGAHTIGVTESYTIDLWLWPEAMESGATNKTVLYLLNNSSSAMSIIQYTNTTVYGSIHGSSTITNTGLNLNSWNHITVCGTMSDSTHGVTYIGVNGTVTSSAWGGGSVYGQLGYLLLGIDGTTGGSSAGQWLLRGSLRDVRITTGVARYTSNYIVPTGPAIDYAQSGPIIGVSSALVEDNNTDSGSGSVT
jgi:hypothetical protein